MMEGANRPSPPLWGRDGEGGPESQSVTSPLEQSGFADAPFPEALAHAQRPPSGRFATTSPTRGEGTRPLRDTNNFRPPGSEPGWEEERAHAPVSERKRAQAKQLRRALTPAERKLWHSLKVHRFQDLHIRRQVPMGPYVADFVCHAARLLIEVNGAQHGFDRNVEAERVRDAWFEAEGYRVLRFWNGQVLHEHDSVLDTIFAAWQTRVGATPPPPLEEERHGLVWIGNWGDDERSHELETFLFRPAQSVGLPLDIYGVRYPDHALDTLGRYGARYRGWLPNAQAPDVFARHLATVHVPRRFYVERLPGIPTIRVFEALACGIPLVSAPWRDTEDLFRIGQDFLMARDEAEMERHLRAVRDDADLRHALVHSGLETIRARHSCAHRVDELLALIQKLGAREPMELSA